MHIQHQPPSQALLPKPSGISYHTGRDWYNYFRVISSPVLRQRNIWRFRPGFIPPPRASGENRHLAHEKRRLRLDNRRSKCTCHRTANIPRVSSIQDSIYAYRLPYPSSISSILTRYSSSWIRGSIQSKCPLFSRRRHQRMHDICMQYGKPRSKASTVNGYRVQPVRCNTPVSFQWVNDHSFLGLYVIHFVGNSCSSTNHRIRQSILPLPLRHIWKPNVAVDGRK